MPVSPSHWPRSSEPDYKRYILYGSSHGFFLDNTQLAIPAPRSLLWPHGASENIEGINRGG